MRKIDYIIIHCSATREGHILTPAALDLEHRRRGFRMTGYHYYIRRDGTTVSTRPLELVGAHVQGYNKHSIGICYEGGLDAQGCPKDTRTPEQRTALRLLVARLLRRFRGNVRICGHRDLSPDLNGNGVLEPWEWVKECPCFDVATEL
ncbi:N-acetylmuramoyl-L-alanine amidase [uncultured Bacteroides sp.]|uniref:N-acetylmuramoyl-L-alanine amidase n=1 Tax=uncultured Bacteroides sp. TaxID=162156 RepID=UPI002606A57B|nr:N-acetylmuramoyl-L-alanine amidase [uncultured Bacteroides sp.]